MVNRFLQIFIILFLMGASSSANSAECLDGETLVFFDGKGFGFRECRQGSCSARIGERSRYSEAQLSTFSRQILSKEIGNLLPLFGYTVWGNRVITVFRAGSFSAAEKAAYAYKFIGAPYFAVMTVPTVLSLLQEKQRKTFETVQSVSEGELCIGHDRFFNFLPGTTQAYILQGVRELDEWLGALRLDSCKTVGPFEWMGISNRGIIDTSSDPDMSAISDGMRKLNPVGCFSR